MSEWKGILHAFERVMQRIGELEVLIRELPQRPSSDPGLALRERALPTGVSMMVGPYPAIFWTRNLSEDEKKTVQTFIEGVLAMKPSAPTAHKPASDEELYELYLKTPEPDDLMVTNSIRAVYNLGRSHGRGL